MIDLETKYSLFYSPFLKNTSYSPVPFSYLLLKFVIKDCPGNGNNRPNSYSFRAIRVIEMRTGDLNMYLV